VLEDAPGSLVELDARFARSRRHAEKRRARLRRPKLRRKLRRPAAAVTVVAVAALGVVGGQQGIASSRSGSHHAAKVPRVTQRCPLPATLRPAFVAAAAETGVSLPLLVAVGAVESQFDQNARSKVGAIGVLQLMPATAAELRLDPSRPETNVLAGARYLRLMLDRYQSTDAALAAYNAGPTAVDAAGGMAPSAETEAYVATVQSKWRALSGCS
jgi:soluble lytic murein transglycosylase-like protein